MSAQPASKTAAQAEVDLPEADDLARLAEQVLDQARAAGATAAEISLSVSRALTVAVRRGELETVEHQRDHDVGISVYFGQRRAGASSTDLSPASLAAAVDQACEMARHVQEDPWQGLADPQRMATRFPELETEHPWALDVETAAQLATRCEDAAFAADPRIRNSEGASVDSHHGINLYANSHGFVGHHRGTRHSIDCSVLAAETEGDDQERDYDYSADRNPARLAAPEQVGASAAQRALRRLNPKPVKTCQVPVLFEPRLARGLITRFVAAISGGNLYRKASFLLDSIDQQIFPNGMSIVQRPHLPGALGSAAFDAEGVATVDRDLITDGILRGYVLGSYSARRLGLESTGNAGGTYNLLVSPGSKDLAELIGEMDRGLIVTEMMGQGANMLTGDYSRGAAGLWVENGEIAHAVDEITVAGNLRDMYRSIREVGSDVDICGNIRCGSMLIDGMTVAGM